jgi:hypothetical protein
VIIPFALCLLQLFIRGSFAIQAWASVEHLRSFPHSACPRYRIPVWGHSSQVSQFG